MAQVSINMSAASFLVNPSASSVSFLLPIQEDLTAVEARMQDELSSEVRVISELAAHLLKAGGKRLRPAMVALSARAISLELTSERIATVGAAVEFVHMATLVHDDVVDNTAMRRGRPTANAVYGNGAAVLSGDSILARSMRLLAIDGDLRIIRTVSEITIEMSEGEVMEITATGCSDLPVAQYYDILRKKTAVFVEGCCRCGAILAGATSLQEEALAVFGFRIGMAFQIVDDLLDYTGDPVLTGKPRGSDLRDGRATLPLLITLEEATSEEREILLSVFGRGDAGEEKLSQVYAILETHDAFSRSRAVAEGHIECARHSLSSLSPSPAVDCLCALSDYIVQRDR